MKLATWNLNSIRAREARLLDWLDRERPDVVCLQETKVEDAQFPMAPLVERGYQVATFGQRSYKEVKSAYADCYGKDEAEVILDVLFPKKPSRVWGIQ